MLNSHLLFIPFVLQMFAMATDEFHFHRRRGLPRFERIGHPLDTLTVLACFVWLVLNRPRAYTVTVYACLCTFSCFFVTKDEPVHRRCCSAAEQWLHALLFTLHPLILISSGFLWPALHGEGQSLPWIHYRGFDGTFLVTETALVLLFGLYQFFYWNMIWRPLPSNVPTEKSTTTSMTG